MFQYICQHCRVVLAVVEDPGTESTPVCPDHPAGMTELVEVHEEVADVPANDS